MTWKVMQRSVWNDIVSWQTRRHNNSTKYPLHVQMTTNSKKDEMGSFRELYEVCSQIVLKCLYLARIGRPDILWSVKKTCSCSYKMDQSLWQTFGAFDLCYMGNTAQQCRLGLFQDSYFAGDLEDSKSTSGGILCIFGSQTFVPISWMCKKQTSVSHSSTEAEVTSRAWSLGLVIEKPKSNKNTSIWIWMMLNTFRQT